jgi:hypothetical protein
MQICNRTPVWNTRGSLGAVGGGGDCVKETKAGLRIGRGFAIRRLCCFQTLVVGICLRVSETIDSV